MFVKALKLLAEVEKGAVSGSAMESSIAASPALGGEIATLLNTKKMALRVLQSDNIHNAFAQSPLAMAGCTSCPYLMTLIGTSASKRAFANLVTQDAGVGGLVSYYAGLHNLVIGYTKLTDLVSFPDYISAILGNATSRAIVTGNFYPTTVFYNNPDANNAIVSHGQAAGPYLNRLLINDGVPAGSAVLQTNGNITFLATQAQAGVDVAQSTMVLLALTRSTAGRAAFNSASAAYNAWTTQTPVSMYWAAQVGADPSSYTSFAAIGAEPTILNAMAANAGCMTHLNNNPALLNVLFSDATTRANIGTTSNFFNAMKEKEVSISKYICKLAGLDSSSIVTYSAMLAQIATIATSNTALDALQRSNGAMAALKASATSLDALFASSNARNFISWQGTFYDQLKDDERAISKYIGALIGVSTTTITTVSSFSNSPNWTAFSNVAAAKMAAWGSDVFLFEMPKVSGFNPHDALRAASSYQVVSFAENNTTPVALPTLDPAGYYLLLGISRAQNTQRFVGINTARPGTTMATGGNSSTLGSTNATVGKLAGPVLGPFSGYLTGTGVSTAYLGLIRCDTDTTL